MLLLVLEIGVNPHLTNDAFLTRYGSSVDYADLLQEVSYKVGSFTTQHDRHHQPITKINIKLRLGLA